jgi:hypothetical protein
MISQNEGMLRPSAPRGLVFAGEAIVDVVMRVPAPPPGVLDRGFGRRQINPFLPWGRSYV